MLNVLVTLPFNERQLDRIRGASPDVALSCAPARSADYSDTDVLYAVAPPRDPQGPATGTRRVSRGGAWRHADPWSPVAHRSSLPPHRRYSDYGVRLARNG